MERERTLNKKYNYDSAGNKIPYESSLSVNYDAEINYNLISGSNNMNTRGELVGRYYTRAVAVLFHRCAEMDRDLCTLGSYFWCQLCVRQQPH